MFLDGDVVADGRSAWSPPLAPANSRTVVAEDDTRLVGFVHVAFDDITDGAVSSTTCTSPRTVGDRRDPAPARRSRPVLLLADRRRGGAHRVAIPRG
jgi:hypothetical protein